MRSTLCRITLGLWIVTIGVAGWFFVQGWTTEGTDGRMAIVLAATERDLILGEMRMFLKAVHGVVTGLAGQDQEAGRTQMEQAARSAGMGMAADVNPALMAKLPLPFKQMGMSIQKIWMPWRTRLFRKRPPNRFSSASPA